MSASWPRTKWRSSCALPNRLGGANWGRGPAIPRPSPGPKSTSKELPQVLETILRQLPSGTRLRLLSQDEARFGKEPCVMILDGAGRRTAAGRLHECTEGKGIRDTGGF